MLDARIVPSGDSSGAQGAGTVDWVIVRVELTNDFGVDAVPQISNFYLVDRGGTHYQAHDSGSSVFTGISNSQDVLPKNQKRIYTFGFYSSDPNVSGDVYYDRG